MAEAVTPTLRESRIGASYSPRTGVEVTVPSSKDGDIRDCRLWGN